MKKIVLASTVALALVSGQAMAVCSGPTRLSATQITTLLTGNTVCSGPAGNFDWQEEHRSGGQLWDYKRGANPIDPTAQVGTWSVQGTGVGNSTVTHSYSGGSSYVYSVYGTGAPNAGHSFCGLTNVDATVKSGSGPC